MLWLIHRGWMKQHFIGSTSREIDVCREDRQCTIYDGFLKARDSAVWHGWMRGKKVERRSSGATVYQQSHTAVGKVFDFRWSWVRTGSHESSEIKYMYFWGSIQHIDRIIIFIFPSVVRIILLLKINSCHENKSTKWMHHVLLVEWSVKRGFNYYYF